MNAGLQVFNNANVLQIDAAYSNFEYKGKYTVALTSPGASQNPAGSLTTPGYANEVLAIGGSASPVALTGRSGNTWTFEAPPVGATVASNQSVTVYLYAKADTALPAHGTGLVVLDASGAVTYNSALQYMKVVWGGRVPDSSGTDVPGLTQSGLAAGNYAALLCSYRYGWFGVNDSANNRTLALKTQDAVQVSANGGSVQLLRDILVSGTTGGGQIGYHINQRAGGDLVLIDVSNL
ncbi:hypothetical protein [Silvimonas sp.]|uniref:hypothetical protein n=1 Tax=Silvimonas sp. TaxID=2650811 RepID=UPI00283E4025|nr:hypothetical protein [Silvimonas sp.]MDR3427907.1 hypothetical protein [Silvimonas sp.]